MFPLALVVGTVSALRRRYLIDGPAGSMLVLASLPSFVVGIALIVVFSFIWTCCRRSLSASQPETLVLPVATLVLGWMPFTARMVASASLSALNSDYVQMARLKGLPEQGVDPWSRPPEFARACDPGVRAHRGWMPAGIVIVEYLFAYPGDRQSSHRRRPRPRHARPLRRSSLILVAFYIVANLLSDIATSAAYATTAH